MSAGVTTAVIWALPDLANESALVAAAPAAGLRIVRRCVDAADLLAHASVDALTTIVVSDGVPRLDADLARRLGTGERHVVGVATSANGARRLADWGVTSVLDASTQASASDLVTRIASVCHAAPVPLAARSRPVAAPEPVRARRTESVAHEQPTDDQRRTPTRDRRQPDVRVAERRPSLVRAVITRLGERFARDVCADGELGTRLVVVAGTSGAPGCSTTAIGVADELASVGNRVLLVDADVRCPSHALMLGVTDETSGLLVAARQADNGLLSARTLVQLARGYRDGLDVLTGLPRPDRRGELRVSALERIWACAREAYDVTVADVGAADLSDDASDGSLLADEPVDACARSAVRAADDVIVVVRGDALGMSRLHLVSSRLSVATTLAVVDPARHASAHIAGLVAGLGLRAPVVRIPWDDAWADALVRGATLAETKPRSRSRRAYRTLADRKHS